MANFTDQFMETNLPDPDQFAQWSSNIQKIQIAHTLKTVLFNKPLLSGLLAILVIAALAFGAPMLF